MPPRSVLLLGASGSFGPALADALGPRVAARTYHRHEVAGALKFDATASRVGELVERLDPRPTAAVLLLGETRIDTCAADPAASAKVNVEGIIRAARELHALGIKPVFVSSDAVFDGSRSYWTEDDEPRPILTYGRQKLEVERFMASLPAPWLVVRLPKLLASLIAEWLSQLGVNRTLKCATDQYFTPADPGDAARALVSLIDQGAQGLYHVAGPERLSRWDLLQVVLDEYSRFKEPRAPLVPCSLRDIPFAEPRPLDLSMRSTRLGLLHVPALKPASAVARRLVARQFRPA